MESVNIHIKKLPEGLYLLTSPDINGLVVQGRTVPETLKIAGIIAESLEDLKDERKTRGQKSIPLSASLESTSN